MGIEAALIGGGLGLLGSSMQAGASRDAAATSAAAQTEAARIQAEAAKFRPVGITTRFGTSRFQMSPEGYLQSAGYTLSPEIAAIQDRLLSQAGQEGLSTQAQQRAQSLFGLGEQFLPTSTAYTASPEALAYASQLRGLAGQVMPTTYDPTAAAQQYVQQQQELLRPERERTLANVKTGLFNTGRTGLSIAQGGDLMAANPELAAYYNALTQQDRQIAAQGTQIGRQNLAEDIRLGTTLGAGALSTQQQAEDRARQIMLGNIQAGTGLFSTGLQLASGGYAPLQTQIGLANTLEQLGQVPMDLGAQLGGRASTYNTNVGSALAQGLLGSAQTMQRVNQYSPLGATLSGLAGNQQFTTGLGNWMSGLNAGATSNNLTYGPSNNPNMYALGSGFDQYLVR